MKNINLSANAANAAQAEQKWLAIHWEVLTGKTTLGTIELLLFWVQLGWLFEIAVLVKYCGGRGKLNATNAQEHEGQKYIQEAGSGTIENQGQKKRGTFNLKMEKSFHFEIKMEIIWIKLKSNIKLKFPSWI